MKIKRLTFSKAVIRYSIIIFTLWVMYNNVSEYTRIDHPIVYMILTIIFYNLGNFIGKELTSDGF